MSEETNDKKNPSLLGILKDAILRSKEKFKDISNREEIIQTLEALKEKVPTSKKDIKTNLYWFKETAKTLFKIPFIKPAVEVIRSELPRIDQQLTVKQKLQVAAIAPVIGAGAFIGTVGLAGVGGVGTAFGVPAIIVILILLFLTNGLIDFMDFLIRILRVDSRKIDLNYERVGKSFEKIFSQAMIEIFKTDFTGGDFKATENFEGTGDAARDYEFFAVRSLAKEFNGEGFVSPQSKDGGIDGYIICNEQREVILVQAKYHSNKVGFAAATQYLGTLKFWQAEFAKKFEYSITKMIIVAPNDFSIEAKRVSNVFLKELFLKTLTV